jgi:hypothetical protein
MNAASLAADSPVRTLEAGGCQEKRLSAHGGRNYPNAWMAMDPSVGSAEFADLGGLPGGLKHGTEDLSENARRQKLWKELRQAH